MGNKGSAVLDDIRQDGRQSSDFSKVVDILLNDKHKRRKTILVSNRQVSKITSLDVIAQIYDIPFLKAWVNNFAEWRTSGDGGKGRQDIVEISKFHYAEQQKANEQLMGLLRK